jgi:hypothetical protein
MGGLHPVVLNQRPSSITADWLRDTTCVHLNCVVSGDTIPEIGKLHHAAQVARLEPARPLSYFALSALISLTGCFACHDFHSAGFFVIHSAAGRIRVQSGEARRGASV